VESLMADVRYGIRHFSRIPLTAITLVLVLSLGIGVNAALFAIVQALSMRPPPGVPADDALVRVRGSTFLRAEGRREARDFSVPELDAIAAHRELFSSVAGFARATVVLDLGDGSALRPTDAYFVTPNFFTTLGVRPAIGPGLPAGRIDDASSSEPLVVITHSLWERLGSDTALVGRVVRVNDVPVRIVGVSPRGFYSPIGFQLANVWMPIASRAAVTGSTSHALASRDSTLLQAVARLMPNVSVEQATAVTRVVAAAWAPEPKPGEATEHSTDVVRLRGFTDVDSDGTFAVVLGLVGIGGLLVLLIVCTNVSALFVGAAVARRREIAVRLSLGASRLRIVRQLVTETSLIALAGGLLGLTLYWWIIRVVAWVFGDIGLSPDLGTLTFTVVIALGTGIIFGLSPALHATRLDVANALKNAGSGATARTRLQHAFIVAQIALTQPLLVGIALVVAVTLRETTVEAHGPLAERIIKVEFGMEGGIGSRVQKVERIRQVMERVATLPGVDAVAPQSAWLDLGEFRVVSSDHGRGARADETVRAAIEGTPPGYFSLQQIPMLRGRELVAADTMGRDLAVVIESGFARAFWGAEDPIGRRMSVSARTFGVSPRTAIVVGVFDSTQATVRGGGRVYTAHGAGWEKSSYLVRSRGSGTEVIPAIRKLARAEIPDIPIYNRGLLTLRELGDAERKDVLQIASAVSGGGFLALLLASIGLYGVVALAVRQREREIGIRVALGARPRAVVRLFLTGGLRVSLLGVAIGLPMSVAAVYVIATSFAADLPVSMPLASVGIAGAVVLVASLASWIPARRAAAVDPILTLKID
jgi:predicted permease